MNPKNFFGELKRRNIYKVAVAYAIVGWLLVQIATQVFFAELKRRNLSKAVVAHRTPKKMDHYEMI
jgi:hypothetical protein